MYMYGGIGVVMIGAIGLVFWGLSAADGVTRKNARNQRRSGMAGSGGYDDGGDWGWDAGDDFDAGDFGGDFGSDD